MSGNITANNITGNILNSLTNLTVTGNIYGGNLILPIGGLVSTPRIINGAAGPASLVLIDASASVTGNLSVAGFISGGGNVIGANISTVGLVTATGNVIGGNILTAGNISAAGIISGASLVGAIATVTGNINAANINAQNFFGGNFYSGLANGTPGVSIIYGNISAEGNIVSNGRVTAANGVFSGGIISAAGTITATGNILGGQNLTVSGTVFGGSLSTTGQVSGSQMSAGGNITGGNVLTGGVVSAVGNVTGGNIKTAGDISAGGNIYGNFVGNITSVITAPGSNTFVVYNNAGNLAATSGFTFNNASNAMIVAGNITVGNVMTANNFIGNRVSAASSNLTLSSGNGFATQVGGGGTFRFPVFDATQLAAIATPVPGDVVYNSTLNKVQAWQWNASNVFAWVSLSVSTYQ